MFELSFGGFYSGHNNKNNETCVSLVIGVCHYFFAVEAWRHGGMKSFFIGSGAQLCGAVSTWSYLFKYFNSANTGAKNEVNNSLIVFSLVYRLLDVEKWSLTK